jgi:sorbitol-6-phosphate 2-dehydrogenase
MADVMEALKAWQTGAVLRGLSAGAAGEAGTASGAGAVSGATAATGGASGAGGTGTVGPGALFRFVPAGSLESAELVLKDPLTPEHIAEQWMSCCRGLGKAPESVQLPSGEGWQMVRSRSVTSSPAEAVGLLTPEEVGGSLRGRVALVTGAAQGFGWEIARGLAAMGAVVALADINTEGVAAAAKQLGGPHGSFTVDVTSEESVAGLIQDVTTRYGGVDLLVSNAGVLKAGSVKTLSAKDFRFVTDVNYVGFFLMTRYTAPVMELQHQGARLAAQPGDVHDLPRYLTDIIEINSKSGLEGSNRNAAYAGSKFGGIGLVQSFALELVEQGTKVNALCPGNFLDGPLWSDPDRGLFVQYLKAGKVPGAQTVADVRRFYEDKVPMKRGCTGRDVLRAIAYIVGQEYETGQAVPVTGGQVMLN